MITEDEKKRIDHYETFLNPGLKIPIWMKILLPIIAACIGYMIWNTFIRS